MRNFISEDDIEQAILQKLSAEPFCYEVAHCDLSPDKLEAIAWDLCRNFTGTDMTATNYQYYNKTRNGVQFSLRRNGKEDFVFVKLVDFERPENNTFTAVSQMWIQGRVYWRRPDVLIFINGLPRVFMKTLLMYT